LKSLRDLEVRSQESEVQVRPDRHVVKRHLPVLRGICGALLAVCGLFAQVSSRTVTPWPGWEQYQVILWSTGIPASPTDWLNRIRDAGFTAEECSVGADCRRFVDAHLGFYVENMLPELAFLHSREAIYKADRDAYAASHDRRYLVRQPCFDDPAFWERISPRMVSLAKAQAGNHPLAYDLRDEPSLGSYTSPMDYCFCPYTLRAFRDWLRKQYPTLDALNREWETNFATWDDVTPMTTFEIKERERRALASRKPENYAPWADHRAYMDFSFSNTLERLRSLVHEGDPKAPVGIAGAQMPSAWGGYDLWRISQAVDWIEPYDVADSRRIFRSFLPPRTPVLSTFFGKDIPQLQMQAWRLLLEGDRGAIVWDDDESRVIQKTTPGMPLTDRARGLRAVFEEVRRVAPEWFRLQPENDHIAIHYSQASIRAHWMFDSREDGNNWLKRYASYEAENSRLAKVRDSFVTVVQDLGFQPDFVSYAQVENGDLIRKGYKVLLLPQSVAMSAAECRNIEAFVRAGGLVIADNLVATMDEHGRRLPRGGLDELFGVHQKGDWKPRGDGAAVSSKLPGAHALLPFDSGLPVLPGNRTPLSNAPMVQERRTGQGAAIFLNLDMHDYAKLRAAGPGGAAYLEVFGQALQRAGIAAPVKVAGAQRVGIFRYTGGAVEYVALIRNQEPGSPLEARAQRIEVTFPKEVKVTDVLRNVELGSVRTVALDLEPSRPILLKLQPAAGGRAR
jgi:hypothetical protein